jgi:hypothetical protein
VHIHEYPSTANLRARQVAVSDKVADGVRVGFEEGGGTFQIECLHRNLFLFLLSA